MREGDVVSVSEKLLNERIRDQVAAEGTVFHAIGSTIWVLLSNGDICIVKDFQVTKVTKDELLQSEGEVPGPASDGDDGRSSRR